MKKHLHVVITKTRKLKSDSPDLILVDGSLGQLRQSQKTFKETRL
ncbi:hypothetical protein ACEW7V_01785 [Areca yellow leaf disease phytoplasma]